MIESPFWSHSPGQTADFARRLYDALHPGSVLALFGALGSGKTCFVRGLAEALDIDAPVTSPTYTLIHEYPSRPPLYHMDLFRIHGVDELDALDLDRYLDGDGICVIEWAERMEPRLPDRAWRIYLRPDPDPRTRMIIVKEPLCPPS